MAESPLRSQLDLLLLATIAGRELHGYAIVEALKERSGGAFDLPEGTIYPALHRLEREGLLQSEWVERAGRRTRLYRLSALGADALLERRSGWARYRSAVEAVLGGKP
jgi:DNA-binding PadR family transcriptional regulator